VRDPLIFDLLDVARAIFNNNLIDTRDLLEQLENEQEKAEVVNVK
jgi:ArsR family transcriptional regulator